MASAGRTLKTRLLVLVLAAIGAPAIPAAEVHRYTVKVDDTLEGLTVKACAAGAPRALAARSADAERHLLEAHSTASGHRIPLENGHLSLAAAKGCVEYRVDLRAAAQLIERYAQLDDNNVATTSAVWLWRPVGQDGFATEVRFELADGLKVSVPWTLIDGSDPARPLYSIPLSPQSDEAVTVFGRFDDCGIEVPGARLRTAVLRGRYGGAPNELMAWIQSAASNVALAYGRFPNPTTQVIVVPVAKSSDDSREACPFGHVIRDGGEAVQFFVNQRRPHDDFIADWTATHEFSHLLIPYITSDEKWISEGLASYYQNLLMARAGAYSEEKAWRKIVEGFQRGEKSVPHLSLEDAMPVGSWDGIMKTYWGGAAVFLLADVELRARSGNQESLDAVLERLQACCLPSKRRWDGRTFFRKLDELSPFPLFERLYDQHRTSRRFPDYAAILQDLGIRMNSGRIRLQNDARLTDVRRAIMAAPTIIPKRHPGQGRECVGGP